MQASTLLGTLHHSAFLWTPPCLPPVPSRTRADLDISLKLSILFWGEDLGFWWQISSSYQQHKLWANFRTGTSATGRRGTKFYFGVIFLFIMLLRHSCCCTAKLGQIWGAAEGWFSFLQYEGYSKLYSNWREEEGRETPFSQPLPFSFPRPLSLQCWAPQVCPLAVRDL